MKTLLRAVFPPRCSGCGAMVAEDFALCATCWRDTAFIEGLVCDACGVPLPGDAEDTIVHCDDCLSIARPWERGRAAFRYEGTGRKMVLALKHGDRTDMARPAARWLARAGAPLFHADTPLVPVPAHWRRLIARRYNQAAELVRALAHDTGMEAAPDLLVRRKRTPVLDGLGREARFAALSSAIAPHPRRGAGGRPVVLIDDVLTSGATLGAAAEAARRAGAGRVDVLVLARVAKDG